jgi:hypothetical protein
MKISKRETGSFLLEMGIIIPLVLLLIFGALEFSRLFTDNHQAQFLSRIAGMDASRRCTTATILDALDALPSDSTPLENCVESIVQTTWNQASSALPELRIILSLYRFDGTNVNRTIVRAYKPSSGTGGESYDPTGSGTYSTKFDAIAVDNSFDAIDVTGNLVVAETFAPFSSRIPYVEMFFGGGSGKVQYSVSVH